MSLSLETSVTPIEARHDAVEDVVGQGATPVVHDQRILFGETRLGVDWAFARAFAADLSVPLRMFDTGIHYRDAQGVPRQLAVPNIHHRDETLTGIGDPWLTVRGQLALGAWRIGGRLGATLPLGKTQEDPFLLGDMGVPHEHFQMGTGTVNPVAGLEIGRTVGPVRLGAWAVTQQVLYENGKGYQAGDRYAFGLSGRMTLGRWTVGLGPEGQVESAERWHGVTREDEGNQGRTDVLLSADGGVALGGGVGLTAGVKVPLYTHVAGGQLSFPVIASLGVTVAFGGAKPVEERPLHDEGHDPGPVAGSVTVIDYWASWCQPCHELDALLARMPGIVVRRVDMTDEHFHFTLPRIKVYGRDGELLLDRGGAPPELARAVEEAIK